MNILLCSAFLGVCSLASVAVGLDTRRRWKERWQKTADDLRAEKDAREELQRCNTELEQFARIASHDLQEPLRTVTTYLKTLLRMEGDRMSPASQEIAETVVEANRRMISLVHSLLAYSKSGVAALQPVPVNLNMVFKEVLSNLDSSIMESNASVTANLLPTVLGDRNQLVQLLQNLVSNALKYQRKGVMPLIHLSAYRNQKNDWVVSVRDNGAGFDKKNSEKIFQPFHRLREVRDQVPGSGIGLAVCKKIAESHGGTIWAISEKGRGSVFCFSISNIESKNVSLIWKYSSSTTIDPRQNSFQTC